MAFESDLGYLRDLLAAGRDGIATARREQPARGASIPWMSTAMGAAVGALSTHLFTRRKSASHIAMGGLVGSLVACGAALAWGSRRTIRPAARGAAQRINAVRDARWLMANPIDYA